MRARNGASRMPFYVSAMRARDIAGASRKPFWVSAIRVRIGASHMPFYASAMHVQATSKVHRASLLKQARCARTDGPYPEWRIRVTRLPMCRDIKNIKQALMSHVQNGWIEMFQHARPAECRRTFFLISFPRFIIICFKLRDIAFGRRNGITAFG